MDNDVAMDDDLAMDINTSLHNLTVKGKHCVIQVALWHVMILATKIHSTAETYEFSCMYKISVYN